MDTVDSSRVFFMTQSKLLDCKSQIHSEKLQESFILSEQTFRDPIQTVRELPKKKRKLELNTSQQNSYSFKSFASKPERECNFDLKNLDLINFLFEQSINQIKGKKKVQKLALRHHIKALEAEISSLLKKVGKHSPSDQTQGFLNALLEIVKANNFFNKKQVNKYYQY